MILCGVDGFRTHRTDSGYSADCHWSNHPWAGPSSQTLWQRPMEKIEGDREGAPDRWNNSYCRGTLVRSSRYRTQGTQDKVSFAGLAMKKRAKQQKYFAVCINNKRYEASLERGKLYRVIPDEDAESHGYLRVVDESGEDYGYSAERFFRLEVPRPLERALLRASS